MALKHSSDFEIHESCKLFRLWCEGRLEKLNEFAARHGTLPNVDPVRVRRALFHGPRTGGFGLLRDLQDLLLLAHQAQTAWTAVVQASKEMKEAELTECALECVGETDRQIEWLCTHIKLAAPQALTVPIDPIAGAKALPALAFKMLLGAAFAAGVGVAIKGIWAKG